MMAEDIQLLHRYAESRDEAAFATLVERHLALVYSAALRQLGGSVHRAEDVTQSIFVDLARNAARLARRQEIIGWLYTSTRYAAANVRRAEARRAAREQESHTMQEILSESSSNQAWQQLGPVLDEAMHELNESDRQAVLLRFFKNERFVDVGRQLGLSEDAARMRVERALDKLHALLAKRGITSTSAALGAALANQAAAATPAGLAASVTSAALSGAAAIGIGSTAAVLHFMSASKIALSLAAAGALAVGFAVYQPREADAARAELASLQREQAALHARRIALEGELRATEESRVAAVAAIPAAMDTTRDAAPATPDPAQQQRALEKHLADHPELTRLRQESDRLWLKTGSLAYFRNLGVPPQQIDQWATWDAQRLGVRRAALANGNPWSGGHPMLNDGRTLQSVWDSGAKMRELFGEAVSEKWVHNIGSGMGFSTDIVDKLAKAQFFTDEPFTADQADQLAAIIIKHYDWTRAPSLPVSSQDSRIGLIAWNNVVRDAEPILSVRQMDSLRAYAAYGQNIALVASAEKQASAKRTK